MCAAFGVVIAAHVPGTQAQSNITLDGSWDRTPAALAPSASATTVPGNRGVSHTVPGNVYTITEAQGRPAGGNLFHSFQAFSVGIGDAAVFTTTTPTLQNVISRVSGSSPTRIDGLLALVPQNGGSPGLYFINPAGVTFGAGAHVDVPGAFHVSTANRLVFADGSGFEAGKGTDSTLVVDAPEAFGFLGQQPGAALRFDPGDGTEAQPTRSRISVAPGSDLTIAGGAVELGSVELSVPQGALTVSAAGDAAVNVPLRGAPPVALTGTVEGNGARLSTTGTGTIHLAGGLVALGERSTVSGAGSSLRITADTILLSGGTRFVNAGAGGSGSVVIHANQFTMQDASQLVSSASGAGSEGETADITIRGRLGAGSSARAVLVSGSDTAISTGTDGAAAGGDIHIFADDIQVERVARITVGATREGNAGSITLTGGRLTVDSGGRIEASTTGRGDGGSIQVSMTGDVSVSGVSNDLQTRSGLFAKTQTSGGGAGGGGGGSGAPGAAGNITIAARNLLLERGAQIDSSTTSGGAGGRIAIAAAEDITIDGSETRLTSDATRGDGSGGTISLTAQRITVREQASVSAATGGRGDAGDIALTAFERLHLHSAGTVTTSTSGSGKGGTIAVEAAEVMLEGAGSGISADTLPPFADLTITIHVLHPSSGDLVVQLESPSGTRVALLSRVGSGGDFVDTQLDDQAANPITAGSNPFTGLFRPREPLAQLIDEIAEGNWTLNVRDQAAGASGTLQDWSLRIGTQTFRMAGAPLAIPDEGTLRSAIRVANPAQPLIEGTGQARGGGGDVRIQAARVIVQDGATISAITQGLGTGGTVTLEVSGSVSVLGDASIDTDTVGTGPAGNIGIRAHDLRVGGAFVSSSSADTASGDAGNVDIEVTDTLTLLDGGSISSSTLSQRGAAGSIEVEAGRILVDGQESGIIADVLEGSSGQTGSVSVKATHAIALSNGGILSIHNHARVDDPGALTPTLLSVSAPEITLENARITAESTGNAAASDISVRFGERMVLDPSSITTTAIDGDGGDIDIQGSGLLWLDHSQITTSVSGQSGDGGNIAITTDILLMETGFIQANTAAPQAQGGDVAINIGTLLSSGVVLVGGDEPIHFDPTLAGVNAIQAAAPDGVSGIVALAAPAQDVAGNLKALSAEIVQPAALTRDLCRRGAGSSLVLLGRGGLRPSAQGLMRPDLAGRSLSPAAARGAAHRAVLHDADAARSN